MKKIIVVLTGVLFAFAVNAQDNKVEVKPQTTGTEGTAEVKPQHKVHDYITMKDGKMMVMKEGNMTPMEKEMEMTNGTKVMTDGSIVKKDGIKMMMKEGDKMYMNGALRAVGLRKSAEEKTETKEQK